MGIDTVYKTLVISDILNETNTILLNLWNTNLSHGLQNINITSTCLDSTACVYSLPKLSSVMDTSSRMMWKSLARWVSSLRINNETCWRWVINWEALNFATTLFKTWEININAWLKCIIYVKAFIKRTLTDNLTEIAVVIKPLHPVTFLCLPN